MRKQRSNAAEAENQGKVAVVLDVGSGKTKAGFAGDTLPCVQFPTVVSSHKSCVGWKVLAAAEEGEGEVCYPVERGEVVSWEDFERVCRHAFRQLRMEPTSAEPLPLLLTESVVSPKRNRERLMELLFEGLGGSAAYLAKQPVLSLYAAGSVTGLVVESGEGVTQVVPVYEGGTPHFQRLEFGGGDITRSLLQRLEEQEGTSLSTMTNSRAMNIVREIKEKHCYVLPTNQNAEAAKKKEKTEYQLPDGTTILIPEQLRYECTETLFQATMPTSTVSTAMTSTARASLQAAVQQALDNHENAGLHQNILLCGGTCALPGLATRLRHELTTNNNSNSNIKFITAPSVVESSSNIASTSRARPAGVAEELTAWTGGSILASLSTFQCMWVSLAEYSESGSHIVHRKCF
ncbi:Actin-like protein 9 [Balamuthia mandrillaris]